MAYVTRREVDLTLEEKEALLHLSRQLSMKDNYAIVTFDEDALRDALAPVAPSVIAPPVPEVPAAEEVPVGVPTSTEEVPVMVTSSLPALVSQEVEQDDSQPQENENNGSEGEGEQHDTVALS